MCGCSGLANAAVATVVVIARHFGFVLCPVSWGNEQEAATHRHRQTHTDRQSPKHTYRDRATWSPAGGMRSLCAGLRLSICPSVSVYLSLFSSSLPPSLIPPPPAWRVCRVCFVLHICLDLLFLFSGRTKLKFSMQICSRVALEISVNTPAHPPTPPRNPSHFSLPTFVLVPFLVALPKCNCFFAWSAANSRKSPH